MKTKYAIKYNNKTIGIDRFNSIEDAEQNLFNNGYHLIENNIHEKFWATLNFDTNKFHVEKGIEIVVVKEEYTSTEITEKILLSLYNQESNPIFQNVSGCQNWVIIKINDQKFRILVEELEK